MFVDFDIYLLSFGAVVRAGYVSYSPTKAPRRVIPSRANSSLHFTLATFDSTPTFLAS